MKEFKYLDHGYVKVIGHWGSDEQMVSFAKASFGKEATDNDKENFNIIRYLFEHWHTSPLESGELILEMKVPKFVFDHVVRHRTASLNVFSQRYEEHPGDYYIPKVERICGSNKWNKQGSGDQLERHDQEYAIERLKQASEYQLSTYRDLIQLGVSKETARQVLGSNFYTVLRWKIDTKNLMHFLKLRNDGHAQEETQILAAIIEDIFAELWPKAYSAYIEFWKESVTFSKTEIEYLHKIVAVAVGSIPRLKTFLLREITEDAKTVENHPLTSLRRRKAFWKKVGL